MRFLILPLVAALSLPAWASDADIVAARDAVRRNDVPALMTAMAGSQNDLLAPYPADWQLTRPDGVTVPLDPGQPLLTLGRLVQQDLCLMEENGPEYNDIIGANVHRAGVNSTVIKNWSTACLVTATLQVFLDWLGWMKKQGRPPLNVAILKEWPKGEQPEPAASELRTLKIGDEGDDVKRLQAALRIKADGIFGRGTRAAVIAFQSERNMRPDGIVGPNTRSEIGI